MKRYKTATEELSFRDTCRLVIGTASGDASTVRSAADALDSATYANATGERLYAGWSFYSTAECLRNLAKKLEMEDTEILNRIAETDTEAAKHKASYHRLLEDYRCLQGTIKDLDDELGEKVGTIANLRGRGSQQAERIERMSKSIAELASKNNDLTDNLRRERKHYDIMIEVLLTAAKALNKDEDDAAEIRFVYTPEDGGLTPEEASELALNLADNPEAFETL